MKIAHSESAVNFALYKAPFSLLIKRLFGALGLSVTRVEERDVARLREKSAVAAALRTAAPISRAVNPRCGRRAQEQHSSTFTRRGGRRGTDNCVSVRGAAAAPRDETRSRNRVIAYARSAPRRTILLHSSLCLFLSFISFPAVAAPPPELDKRTEFRAV